MSNVVPRRSAGLAPIASKEEIVIVREALAVRSRHAPRPGLSEVQGSTDDAFHPTVRYQIGIRRREIVGSHFQSVADAGEFWDSHDLTDYWGCTREASFEVDIQRRVFLTALEPGLARKLTECARKQGVSTETLINVWLTEKITESSQNT